MEKPEIYILVHRGNVQAVRTKDILPNANIYVFDMDDVEAAINHDRMSKADAENELYGETWSEIEARTDAQY